MTNKKKVIIMGAGFGGLASAALLAKEGFDVQVYEKNEGPGGRAGLIEKKGFRFDTGPSWFMMPDVFERYFGELGLKLKNSIKLTPLDPQYRVFFKDRTHYDISSDINKNKLLFEKLEKGAGEKLEQYIEDSKKKYEMAMKHVLYKNADSIKDFINLDLARSSFDLRSFLPIHRHVKKYFNNKKIQQIIEYNLVFLGCSPDNAPALFSMMAHVDFNLGVYYPEGGMCSVVKKLEEIGKDLGVKYHYNSTVKKIYANKNNVSSVLVNGKRIECDILVSNSDYKFTEDILTDQAKRTYKPSYWEKKTMTPSAFLIYLGVKGKLPSIKHHTLYFGDNWKKHFREIFDEATWPKEPSFYINKSSATDNSVAPKGHENLMILVPIAPALKESKTHKKKYAEHIIDYIERSLGVEIAKNVVFKETFSVDDFSLRYNSYKGNALGGLAHTLFQSSFFRPKNKSRKLNNLYFVGANTVPGIGVPTAIISSHLVRDRVKKDY